MRLLRQTLLALFLGPVAVIMTLFAIVILWPFLMVMDWLHEGHANAKAIFRECFMAWDEFTGTIRSVA